MAVDDEAARCWETCFFTQNHCHNSPCTKECHLKANQLNSPTHSDACVTSWGASATQDLNDFEEEI